MEITFKTKHEYCHILDDKLVITRAPEIIDLAEDYAKSVNNVFKTLMVFFISIPVFTAMSIIFYELEMPAFSVFTGAFAFFYLVTAFHTMLFKSGIPVIKKENIYKIKIQKLLLSQVLVIIYKEDGRYKRRSLVLDKEHIYEVEEMLRSEELITDKNIDHKIGLISALQFAMPYVLFIPSLLFLKENQGMMTYYGAAIAIVALVVLVGMLKKSVTPFY